MNKPDLPTRRHVLASSAALVALMSGCASTTAPPSTPADKASLYRGVDRLTWGANRESMAAATRLGFEGYVDAQLKADPARPLLPAAQAQIDALTITRTPLLDLLVQVDQMRVKGDTGLTEDERKQKQQDYQREMTRLAREAASRQLLRDVYSDRQLLEHMTWFWMNHFNVHQYKANLRVMVGDYEQSAVRPHALGRFRDLLGATARHPAMLRYLDNDQNAANRINENYARELMELHTLGVDAGYQQRDVQELARVLTGFGINIKESPKLRPEREALYVRQGAFEFNPNRHDFGDKQFLGRTIKGRGAAELDEVLDLIVAQPATSRFVSRKMAVYLLADEPPPALVDRMAEAFRSSGGRIDATLRVLLLSPEFRANDASARKFKDPMHYVVSAVRTAYEDKVILNTVPMQNWLNRMGEGLYNRQTPDGYPTGSVAWTSSGQLATRFEIARAVGSGSAGLFKSDDPAAQVDRPAFPQLSNAMYFETVRPLLGSDTRVALDQAASPQEWNALFLSSPEFMYR
jgi:uncharacterized protein (DUF1800 family)